MIETLASQRLIVNADDFGLSDGVCAGIAEAMRTGVVTSTTAMVCAPGAAGRIARWAGLVNGRAGLHLQLTSGRPILDPRRVPSLVNADGRFPSVQREIGTLARAEVLAEWEAQLAEIRLLGIEPTHLDSHHHVHRLGEAFEALMELARRHGLPARAVDEDMAARLREARIACPDAISLDWYGEPLTAERFIALAETAAEGLNGGSVIEIMCHPGIPDGDLAGQSRYVGDRQAEFTVLANPSLREALGSRFRLASYSSLREAWVRNPSTPARRAAS